jgi:hypothetical protein
MHEEQYHGGHGPKKVSREEELIDASTNEWQ